MFEKRSFKEQMEARKKEQAAAIRAEQASAENKPMPSERPVEVQGQIDLLKEMKDDADPFTEWELSFMASVISWLSSKPDARMSPKQRGVYDKLVEKYHEYYT